MNKETDRMIENKFTDDILSTFKALVHKRQVLMSLKYLKENTSLSLSDCKCLHDAFRKLMDENGVIKSTEQ